MLMYLYTYQCSPLEISIVYTSVCTCIYMHIYMGLHAYNSTHTFNLFAPISTDKLGLRESSDRSLLAQLAHSD